MAIERIHAKLREDCHDFGTLSVCDVLLNRNAGVPWFILVPDTHLEDVLDLPAETGATVLAECTAVSAFIKQELGFGKVNFAGLGNVVPQMHLHIIGRSETDACWPLPVWGALPDGGCYESTILKAWQDGLVKNFGLKPALL